MEAPVASEREATPTGAAETSGATSTSPSTRSYSCRPSKQRLQTSHDAETEPERWTHSTLCFSCQFVVSDDQDYKAHFTDPDTLVNWDCVQQVVSARRL